MRVWVVGRREARADAEGAAVVLRDLGCNVAELDLWDLMGAHLDTRPLPDAMFVEAIDHIDAARTAIVRLRETPALAHLPVLVAVTVPSLQRLRPEDGFDDFVLFPYVPAELYVRLRRIEWRRSDFHDPDNERLKMGALCIDLAAHEVSVDGRAVSLAHQEFELLAFLAQHRGRVFERDALLRRVWGVEHYEGSRTVDIHVRRVRQKLGTASDLIETVRGVGYKMREPA